MTPIYAVAAVALFFAVVEGGLWVAGVRTLAEETDPSLGFAGAARVYERDEARGVWVTPQRAVKHSFNYQEFRLEKPGNGLRVFTLGGSSAWGFPWGARVAFPSALGRALQATYAERAVESVNAAAMSYGSVRLARLTHEILTYRPDLLIVFEGHNEFVEKGLERRVAQAPRPAAGFAPLLRSRLYSVMARAWDRVRPKDEVPPDRERSVGELLGLDVVRETARYVDDAEKAEAARRFRDNYHAIVTLARAANVPVVLCTVPANLAGWAPNQSEFAPAAPLETRRAVEGAIRDARRLADRDPAGAADLLEAAARSAPEYAETWFRLGEAYAALSRFDEARDAFVRARDRDAMPTRVLAAINDAVRSFTGTRGVTVVDVEKLFEDEASHGLIGFDLIEDYVHPNPRGHRLIARALWTAIVANGLAGERRATPPEAFEAAAGPLEDPVASGEASPQLLYNLGIVLENKGLVDQAMGSFRSCLAKDPNYVAAAYNLGRLLHTRGRFEEAAAAHRQALAADPAYALAMVGLGEALRALGRPGEAREVLERAARLDAANAYAWNGLGAALAAEGRPAEAETAFRRAIAIQPDRTDTRANLGYALFAQRKLVEAETVFREALRIRADHVGSRNGLAAVRLEAGAPDEAARLFEETLQLAPGDEFARAGLAEIERRRRVVPSRP